MHYDPICNCRQGCHKGQYVCISKDCRIPNAFFHKQCNKSIHIGNKCQYITYKSLITKFHKKQGLYSNDFLKFQQRVEKTFDQLLSRLKQQFIKFREQFQHYNATQGITTIYSNLRNKMPERITGFSIYKILNEEEKGINEFYFKNQMQMRVYKKEIMEDYFASILEKLPLYYSPKINFQNLGVEDKQRNIIGEINTKFLNEKQKRKPQGLLKKFFIDFEKLLGQAVYNPQLIYKASQNKFSAAKFHQKCDGMSNTLTMIQTQFGNIIGGFCPFPWQSPSEWLYLEDNNRLCFIFSGNQKLRKIKFQVWNHRQKFAIGMHKQYGPAFGDDIVIYNNANNSKSCWSNFPDVYNSKQKDGKFIAHSHHALKDFAGCSDHYQKFNIIEWEVYKICLSKDEQIEQSYMKQYQRL